MVIEKEIAVSTSYSPAELSAMQPEQLKSILEARGINAHWNAGPNKLVEYVMQSNPGTGGGDQTSPQFTKPVVTKEQSKGPEDNRTDEDIVMSFRKTIESRKNTNPVDTTKGVVSVELIDPKRTGALRVRDYTDINTNEKREFLDAKGRLRTFTIKKNFKLDLSKTEDRLFYLHLKDHPIFVLGSSPSLRLVNTEERAQESIDVAETGIIAKSLIMKLSEDSLKDLARLVGIPFNSTTTMNVLKNMLYQKSDKNPQEIINVWDHPDRELRILVNRGMEKGVITKRNGVYIWGEITFGVSFEECIAWLKMNEDLIPNLRQKTS
jgi:hypothetical protein